MKKRFFFLTSLLSLLTAGLHAQTAYQYSVNLTNLQNDQVQVELLPPPVKQSTVTFSFPKIIPGTYVISDYGKFISNVKAFTKSGKVLPVTRLNDNQWKVANATTLHRITYTVDDIYDSEQKHGIYPMAATNFEEGKNVVVHPPGVFGFFTGMTQTPFEITITRPASFYASTSLKPVSEGTRDVFRVDNVDQLYDAPIMYTVPDTATVKVGNCQVLVSVYSPNKKLTATEIAGWMSDLLEATRKYLGGKLPADKYAFLYYFKDPSLKHNFPLGLGGALEHNTSSFYYLYEIPQSMERDFIVDIASHEFFHIVTPLTIASKEIKEFNWNEADLSKHLWLYEGSTEYTAHHVQVKYGLNSVRQFLDKLSGKITTSRTQYNDALPFTELSEHAAGKHAPQYGNVYQKGALISACLDILLLHLSDGNYSLQNLTHDLGVRYGRNRSFHDEELFDAIAELTYPEVKDFLVKYVAGPNPIPYEEYFGLAGIRFTPKAERKLFSLGGIALVPNKAGVITIGEGSAFNDFGKKVGYKAGDELYAINGVRLTAQNLNTVVDSIKRTMKEGDTFTATVGRKASGGTRDTLTLRTTLFEATEYDVNKLDALPNATPQQRLVQKTWLTPVKGIDIKTPPAAAPADVASIDAIVKALYEVISGPAGPRNWERFHSLFLPEGRMGAIVNGPGGPEFRSMTPDQYQRSNAPHFAASGFFEEELNRTVSQYGGVATVQSSYQFRFEPSGPVQQRGVNYITLVHSGGRWWISNLNWQSETKELPLPAALGQK